MGRLSCCIREKQSKGIKIGATLDALALRLQHAHDQRDHIDVTKLISSFMVVSSIIARSA